MQGKWHKRVRRTFEVVLGLGTLGWVIRLGRAVLEAISDAQTVAMLARHSAAIEHAVMYVVDLFFWSYPG
jgi:hypothetical protein